MKFASSIGSKKVPARFRRISTAVARICGC
jgi:hypothetical protein